MSIVISLSTCEIPGSSAEQKVWHLIKRVRIKSQIENRRPRPHKCEMSMVSQRFYASENVSITRFYSCKLHEGINDAYICMNGILYVSQ